jgi:tetratricopeptide (TPR) repeat protein
MGQPRKAADHAGEALELLGSEPRPATAGALIVLGEARIRLGREQDAIEVLGRAMTCLRQMEPSREVAEGWFNLAELLSKTGDDQHRAEAYRHALSCAGL